MQCIEIEDVTDFRGVAFDGDPCRSYLRRHRVDPSGQQVGGCVAAPCTHGRNGREASTCESLAPNAWAGSCGSWEAPGHPRQRRALRAVHVTNWGRKRHFIFRVVSPLHLCAFGLAKGTCAPRRRKSRRLACGWARRGVIFMSEQRKRTKCNDPRLKGKGYKGETSFQNP